MSTSRSTRATSLASPPAGPSRKTSSSSSCRTRGTTSSARTRCSSGTTPAWPQAFRQTFQPYVGNFASDFNATLVFAKFSAILGQGSTLDFSGDYRHETDIRDFGGQTSVQSATNVKNDVGSGRLKHTGLFGNFLNEATLGYQKFRWNPVPEDSSLVGQNYFGLMRIGEQGDDPGHLAGPLLGPRRPDRDESARRRRPHHQDRGHVRLPQVRRHQAAERRAGVQLPPRYVQRDAGRHAVRGVLRLREPGSLDEQQAVRRLRPGRLAHHAAPHGEPRPEVGLRDGHAEQRLRDAGERANRVRVGLSLELLHGRDAARHVLRRHRAAHRRVLRHHGPGQHDRVRGLGPLLRPDALQRHPRREVPAPVADVPFLLLQGRRPAGRQPRDQVGSVVPEPERPERPHRERHRPAARGLPPRQRHEAALFRPVERGPSPQLRPVQHVRRLHERQEQEPAHLDVRDQGRDR